MSKKRAPQINYTTEATPRAMAGTTPVFCAFDELIDIGKMVENPKNPNKHSKEQIQLISQIIQAQGWRAPITVSKRSGYIVKGHGRLKAAIEMKAEQVPVDFQEYANEAEEWADLIADNRLSELSDMDNVALTDLLADMDTGEIPMELTGFTTEDIESLIASIGGADDSEDDKVDDVPEGETPHRLVISKPGDLWTVGQHRIICGDSTDPKIIDRLMQGEKAQCVNTDPPYGVSYEGTGGNSKKKWDKIANDELTQDDLMIKLLIPVFKNYMSYTNDDAAFYIWHASSTRRDFEDAMNKVGMIEKQYIIWVKNSIVLGRADYQWQHEPCQPAGTKVLTTKGIKNIEELTNDDEVLTYDTISGQIKGRKKGYKIQTTSRKYKGDMFSIFVDGKTTKCTDGHQFTARFKHGIDKTWMTYLMQKGERWRVGITSTYNQRGFGLKTRLTQENGDNAWIIETHKTKKDAQTAEQILSVKYGIPTTHWVASRGYKEVQMGIRNTMDIEKIYNSLDLTTMQNSAEKLLNDYGRHIKYPFCSKGKTMDMYSRNHTLRVRACNLIPEIMELPIPRETPDWNKGIHVDWKTLQRIETEKFDGIVYSLDVEKYHHYIADGIVTHNCFYAEKAGQAAKWCGDRKQNTTWKVTLRGADGMATVLTGGIVVTDGEGNKVFISEKPPKNKKIRYVRLSEGRSITLFQEDKGNTIWEVARETDTEHPTQKPVELSVRAITNSTEPGEIVLDFFGGSHSTMIGAELTGRQARICELEPKYVDVGLLRFVRLRGLNVPIKCERDGKEYDFLELCEHIATENGVTIEGLIDGTYNIPESDGE